MVNFFIDRPIFAWVVALLSMLAGALAIRTLPVAQYPTIAPPEVRIQAFYPGASAQTIENTVTQVIEQQMNGLDHLLYMTSHSESSGAAVVTLTFAPGTPPDTAQVQVQNKLQQAMPSLPQAVQQQGVRVGKSSGGFLMVAALISTDGRMNEFDLANYVASRIQDSVSRVNGVGAFVLFGSSYAMRIWLNPDQLAAYGLTPVDVTRALAEQNIQIAGGQLGGLPAVSNQRLNATITQSTLLRTPKQFGNVLLKATPDGATVRLRDVARIELGAENYRMDTRYNGYPTAGFAIQLAPGANALQTAQQVRAQIEALSQNFPTGLEVKYPYDTTPFVKISIRSVVQTLFEGIALVFLVMYLFLQNLRATLIPTIAVPVVLLGTFAVMAALGFSINTLSMFGMVLAIGLLVDDAIVVVENVERVMHAEGLSPREATRKAMGQISGALVGIGLVLSAVFVPMAFFGGSVGAIYRQFSVTIVCAMTLSVLVALFLTPALCASVLKPLTPHTHASRKGCFGAFFGAFNRSFEKNSTRYQTGVARVMTRRRRWLCMYGALLVGCALLYLRLPTGFLPLEDQGNFFINVQTAPGATQERTRAVLGEVSRYLLEEEGALVESTFEVAGFNFSGSSQNAGIVFVKLKDWNTRSARSLRPLIRRTYQRFSGFHDALMIPIPPPAIPELGNASGFSLMLQDRAGLGHEALIKARDQLLGMAQQNLTFAQVYSNGLDDTPEFEVKVDREKASALGVPLALIDRSSAIAWASAYVNNFLDTDYRFKRVIVQGDAPYRMNPDDIGRWQVKNARGEMVPLSALTTTRWGYGSPKLERYNGMPAVNIQGAAAPGKSSGDAMREMEKLISQLPEGIGYEWIGLSYQERQSGAQAPLLYAMSILVVFLSLAALYESWAIPFSVLLAIPLGVMGALLAVTLLGLSNDVYFQVALLTTVGLSAKNAILIVEFAKDLQAQGKSAFDAALEAARLRLRPILMTSMAFTLGVLPLAISTGPGAASRHAVGVAVMGGMLSATFIALFMIPMFYLWVMDKKSHSHQKEIPAL